MTSSSGYFEVRPPGPLLELGVAWGADITPQTPGALLRRRPADKVEFDGERRVRRVAIGSLVVRRARVEASSELTEARGRGGGGSIIGISVPRPGPAQRGQRWP